MLGHQLCTHQSGDAGLVVDKLYVTEHVQFKEEFYLAITIDREMYSPPVILSAAQLGPLRCPVVVRLQGTNSEKGQRTVSDKFCFRNLLIGPGLDSRVRVEPDRPPISVELPRLSLKRP
jgi:succinyl-CoA synthetase beta subunit